MKSDWAVEATRKALAELGYTTVYQETGKLAFYPKDLERIIETFSKALRQTRQEAWEEAAQLVDNGTYLFSGAYHAKRIRLLIKKDGV